jgi:hypothetical protein
MKRSLRWLSPDQLAAVEASVREDPPDPAQEYDSWKNEYFGPLPVFSGMICVIAVGFVWSVMSSIIYPDDSARWFVWVSGGVLVFMALTISIMRQLLAYSAARHLLASKQVNSLNDRETVVAHSSQG